MEQKPGGDGPQALESDQIDLEIQWEGNSRARVHFIIDNDEVVVTEDNRLQGANTIPFSYQARAAPFHVIEGSLWFPGTTVRKLVVKASVNRQPLTTVDAKKDDTKNQWSWRGAAP